MIEREFMSEDLKEKKGSVSKKVSFPCEKDGVLQLLPHRDPFVWVSRIIDCEPGKSIKAELDVDPNLDLFKGHFPGMPILPGVIIMEALAQASCCCLMSQDDFEGSIGFLAGIDKAKFRETVVPGDTLTLEANIVKKSRRFCKAEVVAKKGDKVCASAQQNYVIAKEG